MKCDKCQNNSQDEKHVKTHEILNLPASNELKFYFKSLKVIQKDRYSLICRFFEKYFPRIIFLVHGLDMIDVGYCDSFIIYKLNETLKHITKY